jgi:integrase/recombinase XerD
MSAVLRLLQRPEDDAALIQDFVLGRPAGTQRVYAGEIRSFLRWVNKPSVQVQSNDLRGYIESCRRQALRGATLHRKVVIVKAFFAFHAREKQIPQDPVALVDVPPCPIGTKPKGLTPDDARRFFTATSGNSMAAIRDRGMFLLMSATGLRMSEVCRLSVRDVRDAEERDWKILRVLGKGEKEREVHVSPEVWAVLVTYIQRRQDELTEATPLFATVPRGKSIQPRAIDSRLSPSTIYERFKRLARKAELPGQLSPHSLRHFFACEADAAGASVEAIRLALGHAGLGTTQRYLQRMRRGINEAFAKIKPPKVS